LNLARRRQYRHFAQTVAGRKYFKEAPGLALAVPLLDRHRFPAVLADVEPAGPGRRALASTTRCSLWRMLDGMKKYD